jgi:uncharacterized RDD family membrane protein YckC
MYKYGTFSNRLLAFLVDQLVILLFFLFLTFVGGLNIIWGISGLIFTIYSMIFVWHSGSTIGKKIFRLKVVNANHKPMSFWRTILREGPGKIISGFLNLGFLWVLIDKKRQAWHDKIAKTYVLQVDRTGNLIPASTEDKVTRTNRITFWILFLLFSILVGLAIIFSVVYLILGLPIQIPGQDIIPKLSF